MKFDYDRYLVLSNILLLSIPESIKKEFPASDSAILALPVIPPKILIGSDTEGTLYLFSKKSSPTIEYST
jgi:hypothetical protein